MTIRSARTPGLVLGAALLTSFFVVPAVSRDTTVDVVPRVSALNATPAAKAAISFVNAMSDGDAPAVWMYATEEEHDAFGTEKQAFEAYADAFPNLLDVESVEIARTWQEGDTPFVTAMLVDESGEKHLATMGFWLDDAGDWKLVSCDVQPLSDRVASR